MHVLVTRPRDDGELLKSGIEALGCKVSVAPLIDIVPNEITADVFDGASAVVVTSRNALKVLAASPALTPAKALPLVAVGPGTATLAASLGFKDVFAGPGTGAELAPEIIRRSKLNGGLFVYLSGDKLAFDLPSVLGQHGVNIRRIVAYRSVPVQTLPSEVASALREGAIDIVVLMSPKTAETWVNIAPSFASASDLSKPAYICISEAVANVLRTSLPAPNVAIADRPNLEEIFIVLKRLAVGSEAE